MCLFRVIFAPKRSFAAAPHHIRALRLLSLSGESLISIEDADGEYEGNKNPSCATHMETSLSLPKRNTTVSLPQKALATTSLLRTRRIAASVQRCVERIPKNVPQHLSGKEGSCQIILSSASKMQITAYRLHFRCDYLTYKVNLSNILQQFFTKYIIIHKIALSQATDLRLKYIKNIASRFFK